MTTTATRPARRLLAASASEAPPRTARASNTLTALPGGVTDGGELIILAVKPSMWRPLFDAAPWLIVCSAGAAAVTALARPIPGLSLTATAQVVLLVGVTRLALDIARWIPTWYVLTNRRIITVRGVRQPRITACRLVDVRNTYTHHSPMERVARLGTIIVVTDDQRDAAHVWQSVNEPHEVHQTLRRAIRNALDQQEPLP